MKITIDTNIVNELVKNVEKALLSAKKKAIADEQQVVRAIHNEVDKLFQDGKNFISNIEKGIEKEVEKVEEEVKAEVDRIKKGKVHYVGVGSKEFRVFNLLPTIQFSDDRLDFGWLIFNWVFIY